MKRLTLCLLLAVPAAALPFVALALAPDLESTAPAGGADQRLSERLVIPLSSPDRPATIEASLVNGGIRVEAWDGKEVVVVARSRDDDDEDEDDRERERERDRDKSHQQKGASTQGMRRIPNVSLGVSVEEEDNVVSVGSESWGSAIDLEIKVPRRSTLNLSCVNDGDIRVSGVDGEIELSNVNGGIEVLGATGTVVANTVNGDLRITFQRTAGKDMAFSTLNGDIDLELPAGYKANLVVRSDNGEIFSDFDVDLARGPAKVTSERREGRYRVVVEKDVRGTIGGGGPELRLQTFNGDIYLRKAGG